MIHGRMTFLDAQPLLVPLLRPTSEPPQALRAAALDPARALVRQRVVPFLHTLLAVDHGTHLKFVSVGQLADWDVHPDLAFGFARENLDPTTGLRQREDGLWALASGDGYDAARLALPGWLAAWSGDRPVLAAVPHSRLLLVCPDWTPERAMQLLALARDAWEASGDPLSPALYTVGPDARLAPWVASEPGSLQTASANAHKELAHRTYQRQREALADLLDENAPARHGLIRDEESGRLLSVCAWTEGTRPLLPLTDVVVMHPQQGEALWLPLQALAERLPGCFTPWPDLDPPRIRPSRWPAEPEWKQLAVVAIKRGAR